MQWFFLLPLRERHDQDEERAHEVDCGVRLILVWWRRWELNNKKRLSDVKIISATRLNTC